MLIMDANKEIKVYGTLVNWTHNDSIADDSHNDAVAYAKQLYDDNFGAQPAANNFQDVINKRITNIQYENGNTIISGTTTTNGIVNQSGSISNPEGEISSKTLNISSTGNIGGNLTVTGNVSAVNTDAAINTVNRLDADVNTEGSVKYQIEEAKTFIINKIVDGDLDPETIDCLVDIINWIDEHKDDAAAMLRAIQELEEGLSTEIENRTNGDAALRQDINIINGDEDTEGSISYAVKNGYVDHSASDSTCEDIIDELS